MAAATVSTGIMLKWRGMGECGPVDTTRLRTSPQSSIITASFSLLAPVREQPEQHGIAV